MRKFFICLSILALTGAAPMGTVPTKVANPVALMSYLVGTWSCTASVHGKGYPYKTTFSYQMGQNWLQADEAFGDGSADRVMISYITAKKLWRVSVVDSDREAAIMDAPDTGLSHLVFKSVYPDASMMQIFDRVTPSKITLHFSKKTAKGTFRTANICTKD